MKRSKTKKEKDEDRYRDVFVSFNPVVGAIIRCSLPAPFALDKDYKNLAS